MYLYEGIPACLAGSKYILNKNQNLKVGVFCDGRNHLAAFIQFIAYSNCLKILEGFKWVWENMKYNINLHYRTIPLLNLIPDLFCSAIGLSNTFTTTTIHPHLPLSGCHAHSEFGVTQCLAESL